MTDPNLTLIAFLVDRSGSMQVIREDTEGGLSSFLEDQRQNTVGDSRTEVWLSQFDNEYESVYSGLDINDLPAYTLRPRGSTALVDSMHRLIVELGESLRARPEAERPGRVIVVTLTDGAENSSHEVTAGQLRDLIRQQEDVYSWDFVFLGANIDAVSVGALYGIDAARAMSYSASTDGVDATFSAVSRVTTALRSGDAEGASFNEDERSAAVEKN